MDRRCECIVCVNLDQSEVLFNLDGLRQRGPVAFWVSSFLVSEHGCDA